MKSTGSKSRLQWAKLGMPCTVVLCGLVLLGMVSCGDLGTQSRRGGGIEIPNGIQATVVVRITDSSGTPLPNTPLQLIAGETWADRVALGDNVVLDSINTDSQGLAKVELVESRMFLLARNATQGIHLALYPRDSLGTSRSNPMPIPLRKLSKLQIASNDQPGIALFGTPWRFRKDNFSDKWVLDSVPSGEYMTVKLDPLGLGMGHTLLASPFDTSTSLQQMVFSDPNNLRLTNFENRRLLGIWDPLHVGGYWWATATVNGVDSWDHFGMHVLEDLLDSAEDNIFANVTVQFLTAGESTANFGLDFSTEPVNTNLSKATHVSFLAKGVGNWTFYVQTQDPDGSNSLRWRRSLALEANWQQWKIPLDSMECETIPGLEWNASLRLGTNLFWQTESNGQIAVDDIVLNGLRFEDWVDP